MFESRLIPSLSSTSQGMHIINSTIVCVCVCSKLLTMHKTSLKNHTTCVKLTTTVKYSKPEYHLYTAHFSCRGLSSFWCGIRGSIKHSSCSSSPLSQEKKDEGTVWEAERGREAINRGSIGRLYCAFLHCHLFCSPSFAADTQIIIKADDCRAGTDLQGAWTNQSQKLRLTVKASSSHFPSSSDYLNLCFLWVLLTFCCLYFPPCLFILYIII